MPNEKKPIFGSTPSRFGKVLAMLNYESKEQGRLLQRVLEQGMKDFAGKPEETFLAACYNDIERNIERSQREKWVNWVPDERAD